MRFFSTYTDVTFKLICWPFLWIKGLQIIGFGDRAVIGDFYCFRKLLDESLDLLLISKLFFFVLRSDFKLFTAFGEATALVKLVRFVFVIDAS